MRSYLRYTGSELPHNVGVDIQDGIRASDGKGGHLSYGPYITFEPGEYVAGFYIRRIGSPVSALISIDVHTGDDRKLASEQIPHSDLLEGIAGLVVMPFRATDKVDNVEIRCFVPEGVLIEIHELVIFRGRPRSWKGQ